MPFANPFSASMASSSSGTTAKKMKNAHIKQFETIAITYQIYEGNKGNYLLAFVVVAISQRSYPQAQPL
jgi:hypothetical protein